MQRSEKRLSLAQSYRRPRNAWFWIWRGLVAATVVFVLVVGVSLIAALRAPGDDSVAKIAEWARAHNLGPVVTLAESVQFRLHPPQEGGTPDTTVLAAGVRATRALPHGARSHAGPVVPVHAPMSLPNATPLPGEGVFVPQSTRTAGNDLQVTYVRPDRVHTSYLAGVVWMSHDLRFTLHPGYDDPGVQGMSQPDRISSAQMKDLVAAFNGGFRMADAGGGYYDHGHTVGTLVKGAASLVIDKQGHATVGTWGQDVSMNPNVAFVRQNLKPLISNGVLAHDLNANVESTWGTTLGGAYAVWRSGIGVTASGDLVYVMGDALTVSSLADLLHRAGAVTAMQLDINKAWVSFMWFSHKTGTPQPHKVGSFVEPASRYFSDTSRDFFTVSAPAPTKSAMIPGS